MRNWKLNAPADMNDISGLWWIISEQLYYHSSSGIVNLFPDKWTDCLMNRKTEIQPQIAREGMCHFQILLNYFRTIALPHGIADI